MALRSRIHPMFWLLVLLVRTSGAQNLCPPEPAMDLGLGGNVIDFVGVGAVTQDGQGFYWVDRSNNLNWNRVGDTCGPKLLVSGTSLGSITDVKPWTDGVYIAAPPYIWLLPYSNLSLTLFSGPFSPQFHSIALAPTKLLGQPFLFVADRGAGCVRAVYGNGTYDSVGGCGGDVQHQQFTAPSWVLITSLSAYSAPAIYVLDGSDVWTITPLRTGGKVTTISTINGAAVTPIYLGKLIEERYAYGFATAGSGTTLQCGAFRLNLAAEPYTTEFLLPLSPCPMNPRQATFLANGTIVALTNKVLDQQIPHAIFGFNCSADDRFIPTTPFVDVAPCNVPPTPQPATTFSPLSPPTPEPTTAAPTTNRDQPAPNRTTPIVVGVVVSVVGVLMIGAVVVCFCLRRSAPVLPVEEGSHSTVELSNKDHPLVEKAGGAAATLVASHIRMELSDTLPAQHSQSLSMTQVASSVFEAEPAGDTVTKLPRSLVSDGSMAIDEGENVEERQLIRIGEFTKLKLLGRGAFGSVYSCLLGNGRTIAMKEMMLSHQDFSAIVSDVEREVEVMREIRHPNVIQYISARCDREHCTITLFMELVTGGSLGSMVRGLKEPMPERTVQKLMRQAAQGLAFIHSKGIIHRDLKGDNMLLTADGVVKLADFGTAKQVGSGTGASRGAQTMIGTPYYMAPELLLEGDNGEIGYGIKADVWSFGITVGELLNNGIPPWPAFSNPGQAFLHIAGAGNLPLVPDTASPLAKEFMLYCCRRDPKSRPTSAQLLDHPWLQVL